MSLLSVQLPICVFVRIIWRPINKLELFAPNTFLSFMFVSSLLLMKVIIWYKENLPKSILFLFYLWSMGCFFCLFLSSRIFNNEHNTKRVSISIIMWIQMHGEINVGTVCIVNGCSMLMVCLRKSDRKNVGTKKKENKLFSSAGFVYIYIMLCSFILPSPYPLYYDIV